MTVLIFTCEQSSERGSNRTWSACATSFTISRPRWKHKQSYLECLREEELFQLSSLRPLGRSVTAVADIPLLSKLEHELHIGYPEANPSLGALAVLNHHVTLCAACASRGGARRICQGSIAGASLELLPVLQTALQPLQPCMQPKLVHRATFLLLCGGGEFGAQPNVCTLSTTQHLVRISLVDAPASRDSTPAEHTRSRREQAVYVSTGCVPPVYLILPRAPGPAEAQPQDRRANER